MFKLTSIRILGTIIACFILGVSLPVQAKRIQDIAYAGGGKIIQYKDDNVIAKGKTRLCLINRTGQEKMMKWIRVLPQGKVNHVVVRNKGGKGCVTIPSNQRIEWTFRDRGKSVRKDAMTLNNWSGKLVTFDWVKDNNHLQKKKLGCGALNHPPCQIWERRPPSCNKGLVENFLSHRCVKGTGSVGGDIKANAEAVLKDSAAIIRTLGGYITCFDARILEAAIKRKDAKYAKTLQNSSCVKRMGAVAYSEGYNTMTVGISGGGAFILGTFVDTGFAFDTKARREPTLYQTKAFTVGIQIGGGVGINLGLYKGSNKASARGSDTQGFTFEAGAGVGGGTGVWYDYKGRLDGVSVSAIAGVSGKAGAYNRINTSYYNLSGPTRINCGSVNKRACKVWERVPSCNRGLYEQIPVGICRSKKALKCGAVNQRACKVWERIPSCNRGLYEKFPTGMCRAKAKPKPVKKLNCGARNQRPCKLWERVPSCNKGLHEDFFAGRCK